MQKNYRSTDFCSSHPSCFLFLSVITILNEKTLILNIIIYLGSYLITQGLYAVGDLFLKSLIHSTIKYKIGVEFLLSMINLLKILQMNTEDFNTSISGV